MQEVTLQELLEAGCHFGHKSERWHPRASQFIYTEKDGIHIIDLAKTKVGLEKAMTFIRDTVASGGEVLFVGTKRQARGVVKESVDKVGAPYFVERWIGGFMTNWDGVKKNIEKINRLTEEEASGIWKKQKRPKHEQVKLSRYLKRLKVFYGGVLRLTKPPDAIVVVDVRKEDAAVREARRRGIPSVGIVDTNSDPRDIDYVIAANDDAVGSVKLIIELLASAYQEGKTLAATLASQEETKKVATAPKSGQNKENVPVKELPIVAKDTNDDGKKAKPVETKKKQPAKPPEKPSKTESPSKPAGKRGRPKKTT